MAAADPFYLDRFVQAQKKIYPQVIQELRRGAKTGHWMWFIFPQFIGLGQTPISRTYAIKTLDEARAYAQHSVLGQRLQECTELVIAVDGKSANTIFGHPDDLKFRSSMTLFLMAVPEIDLFQRAINKYYNGEQDARTLELLERQQT
ncbi:MAG: DUF1810 domain-containing protein [Desulfofustis sp.]|jgi:uncharacterized protein (DUF1810 family)|nr:DUF1810 domain-containing protein [Desulfofustis sp.]